MPASADRLFALLTAAAAARDPEERADLLDEAMRSGLTSQVPRLVSAAASAERRRALLMWMRLFPGVVDVPFVATCQSDPDPAVRAAAVGASRTLTFDEARPLLSAGLGDTEATVRLCAVRELGARDSDAARGLLPPSDPDATVARWLAHFRG